MTRIDHNAELDTLAVTVTPPRRRDPNENRNCGTGAGGFQVGNTCAKGGADTGLGPNRFVQWHRRNESALDGVRQKLQAAYAKDAKEMVSLAEGLSADEAASLAASEQSDEAREASKESKKELRALVSKVGTDAEKELMQHPETSEYGRFTVTPNANPEIEAARLATQAKSQESIDAYTKSRSLMDSAIEKDKRLQELVDGQREAAIESLREIGTKNWTKEEIDKNEATIRGTVEGVAQGASAAKLPEAAEFYGRIMSPANGTGFVRNLDVEVDSQPIREHTSQISVTGEPRRTAVFISQYSSTPTIVHELGHAYEDFDQQARDLANAFRDHRCLDTPDRPMSEIVPGAAYAPAEVGNTDDFLKTVKAATALDPVTDASRAGMAAYVGKTYGTGRTRSTEILSMGFEMLYRNPAAFAAADPEYFDLIAGIATGVHRK